MNRFSRIVQCILFLLALQPAGAVAQGFLKGTLITTGGDSLDGWVCPKPKVILFQRTKQETVERYKFKDVQSFIMNEQMYVLRSGEVLRGTFPERVTTWMAVKVDGPVRLLEYYGKDLYGGLHLNYFIEEQSGLMFRIEKGNFKKQMSAYFAANEEISKQISEGQVGYENMPAIMLVFNAWLTENLPPPPPPPLPSENKN